MELISSIGTLIASAAAGIVGHFVAHDLYRGAPRYAKRLLDHAVKVLPENDRDRYAEEWLAHLYECMGVIVKFRHAVECSLIARKLRQIVEQRTAVEPHAIEFVFLSKGQATARVSMDCATALPMLAILKEAEELKEPIKPETFVPSKEIKELLADPDVKVDRIFEIRVALLQALESGQPNMKVHVVDRFGRAMTKNEMEAWIEESED
jgi:hypothetical protein